MASEKMKHLSSIRQLSLIMSGQPDAPPPAPTAPRVETATPPRVVVAVPPRAATTLNTITALNNICQLPIVHQQVTCNNHPFQILSDDDDEDDDEMVVASNCSPKTPLHMLHEGHGPIAIPPTIPRPTTHRLQVFQEPNPPLILLPPVMPLHRPNSRLPKAPPTALPQILVIVPSVNPSIMPQDLRPHHKKRSRAPAPTAMPRNNIIEPNNNRQDCLTSHPATPPRRFTRIINTCMPGNISIQAMHHVMTLEAFKVATSSQWTGPIIDIEEHCFGIVHPVTKQTITQYKKLQHDPDIKHLWVPAMSTEVNHLAQGKEGVTKAKNTIFFLSHKEIWCIPTNRTVSYARIVIDHHPQKEDHNHVCITVGWNLINYPFELTTRTTDMVSSKFLRNSTIRCMFFWRQHQEHVSQDAPPLI
jgi:hypothetical protein